MSSHENLVFRGKLSALLSGLALVCACDTADASSEDVHARALGDAGVYEFEISGDPLAEGANDLTIHVYLDGQAIDDVSVIARTVMPTMGHPTSEVSAEATPSGEYEASLIFSMPGAWDVEIEIAGEPSDSVVFRVEVQ